MIGIKKQLHEVEELYRIFFDKGADGILVGDIESKKFLLVNPAICEMLGYSKEELEKMEVKDIHPKDYLPQVISELEAQAREEKTLAENIPMLRKDGVVFYADINTVSEKIGGKKVGIGFFRDVTEKTKLEQNLKRTETRFRQVLEISKEWVWEIDASGLYTFSSQVAEKLLGYSVDEMVGKMYFYDLFLEEEREELKNRAFEFLKGKKKMIEFKNKIVKKNGEVVLVLTSGLPIIGVDGELLGYRGIDVNITNRGKVEEELRARIDELDKINKLMVGRELKMVNLKEQLLKLESTNLTKSADGEK